ncbi:bidirectional sugar transporter SWEET14-like [Zingiber officinale]|uniref:bidirectional sugar transporter SWEET14-like n=1 Tax=Zingiber officinale TaxID=94328 RepID=UPI001C4C1603|nr:bidirectional sugar transporter SWEET14-like [Zingiber officinale]
MAAGLSLDHPLPFIFGILGNLISFMVYLAPLPTFYRVCRKKSTEGFSCLPYVVALFAATLWIFYALLKPNAYLLITINTVGCIIETAYLLLFFAYASKAMKIYTAKLVLSVNLGVFGLILVLTLFLTRGSQRVQVLGWICMCFSVSVFVAPLSIIRLVIRTKSVEFMPFWLSFFLTISAVVWFGYGLLIKDFYVALPNVLGFIFGILQMVLYIAYKGRKEGKSNDGTLPIVAKTGTGEKAVETMHKDSVQLSQAAGDEEKVDIRVKNNCLEV